MKKLFSNFKTENATATFALLFMMLLGFQAQSQTITSFNASGYPGSTLVINGTSLSGATAAGTTIGGTSVSSITSNTDLVLTVVVGSGTTGVVSVNATAGTIATTSNFTFLLAADGDYRSASALGTWSTAASWQVRASGSWTTASSAPTSSDNVFIQAGHTMTVDANGSCNDLQLNTTGVLALGSNNVSINGKIRAYTGTAVNGATDSTFYSGQTSSTATAAAMITSTASVGFLKFVGNTRNINNSGEWNSSSTSNDWEFALTAGQIGTTVSGFKGKNVTISSGTLSAGSSAFLGASTLFRVLSGAKVITARTAENAIGSSSSVGTPTITFDSGSTVEFTGAAPSIWGLAFNNNGTISFNATAAQVFLKNGNITEPADVLTYANLTIGGNNTKTMPASATVTVSGTFATAGTSSSLALTNGGSSILSYGSGATFSYGSSNSLALTTTSLEWPSINGPTNVIVGPPVSGTPTLSFTASAGISRTIPGTLTLNGSNFTVNTGNTLTFGDAANIIRSNTTSSLNVSSGSILFGTTSAGIVNVTINTAATLTSGGECASVTSPGKLGTLTVTGTNYTFSGNRGFTNVVNNGSISILPATSTVTFSISGTLTGSGTIIPGPASTLTGNAFTSFNSGISITGTGALGTLNIDQTNTLGTFTLNRTSSGSATLGSNLNVTTLTLTSGVLTTGSNTASATTVTGGSATAYINGMLKRAVSPSTVAFPVGDATNYTPVSLVIASGTGNFTASTAVPNAAPASGFIPTGSGISQSKYINRNWTLTTDIGSPSYSAQFTYIDPADIVGSANTSSLIVGQLKSSTWTNPGVASSSSPSVTTVTGLTQDGTFSLGEVNCVNVELSSASATATPICSNATTTLIYNGLFGTGASVTWYSGTGGTGTSYGTGTPSSAVAPGTYYAYATGTCGSPVEIAVTVGANALPTVAAITGSASVCMDSSITLSDATSGGVWTSGTTATATIDSSTGVITTVAAGTTLISYTVTNGNGCVTTVTKTITVNALPAITSQPATASQSVCVNASATSLSIGATVTALTYQWYSNAANNNTTGTAISGATSASYSPATASAGATYYYCIVSGTCSPSETSTVSGLVTVFAPITYYVDADADGYGSTITASLCSLTAPAGYATNNTDCDDTDSGIYRTASFYVDADGDYYTVGSATSVCYGSETVPSGYSVNSLGTDCDDSDALVYQSASLYIDVDNDGYDAGQETVCYGASIPTGYKVTTSGADCNDADNLITSSVTAGTISGGNVTICANQATTLTLTGNSSGSIAWYKSYNYTAGTPTWTLVSGSTSTTFTAADLTTTAGYKAIITNGTCSAETTVVSLTINSPTPTFAAIGPICIGTSFGLQTTSTNGITGTWSPAVDNTTTTTYTFTPTAGQCAATTTLTVIVNPTVNGGVLSPWYPTGNKVCLGNPITFILTGSVGTIKWQDSPDNVTFSDIDGETTTTYTVTPTEDTYYRAVITNGVCSPATHGGDLVRVYNASHATAILGAGAVCFGTAKELTVESGYVGTIQWQYSTNGTTWITLATASPTYTVLATKPVGTYYYKAILTSGACSAEETVVVTVTVTQAAVAGTVAPNVTGTTICSNTDKVLKLTGSVGNIQWQSTTNNSTWSDVGTAYTAIGNSNPVLYYTATGLTTSTYFRAVATTCTVVNTTPLLITVNQSAVGGTISGGGILVCAPTNTTTLILGGSTGAMVWQKSVNPTASIPTWVSAGSIVDTFTAANLLVPTSYRVLLTSGICKATSDVVAIPVSPVAKAGTITASTPSVCLNGNISFTLTGYTGSSIEWKTATSLTGTFTSVQNSTSNGYTAIAVSGTKLYVKAIVSSGACTTATTAVKTIIVNPLSVAGSITGGGTVCSRSAGALKVAGYVGTIQWEYSTNGTTYGNVPAGVGTAATSFISGSATGKSATYLVSGLTADTYFRAKITSGVCSSSYTSAVQYVIGTAAAAGSISGTATVCTGTGTTLTLADSVGAIQWQKATVSTLGVIGTFANIAGKTAVTIATGNLTATTAYRAVVTIGACSATVTSANYTVTVNKIALFKPISGFNTFATAVFVGTPKTLTLGAGYIGSIEWLSYDTLAGIYVVIAGETASTYVYTPAAAGVMYFKVRMTSISPCSATTSTSTAGVAVYAKASGAKSISEAKTSLSNFSVKSYPNPFRESFKLNFSGSQEKVSLQVYDMLGRKLENKEISSDEANELSIGQNLPSGMYNLRVIQVSNVKTLRVIKN